MRRLVAPLVVIGACTSGTPAPETATAPAQGGPTVHVASGDGAVVSVPIEGSAVVAVRVAFLTGSSDDPPGKEGLTALTARLMAEGGTARLSYPDLLTDLYPMAASIHAAVDKEQTAFVGTVHADHAARFSALLAEVVSSPRLPDNDFTRIRENMLNDIEKRLRATDDENLGKELLNLMLYGGGDHPYRHFVGGTVEGLKSITVEDVRAHAKKVFGKKRLVVGLGGAASEAIAKSVTGALASLPEGEPRLATIPPARSSTSVEVLIANKPGKAVAVSMGFGHDAYRGHPDFPALAWTQSYFGEHRQFHGVLMNEMRGRRGLNYGDYAYVENFVQSGWSRNARTNIARRQQHFEIWIRPVDPKDAVFSIRLAVFLCARLLEDGVTDDSVGQVRTFLEGYTRLWDLTPSRKVGHAIDDHFYGMERWLDRYREAMTGLDGAAVNAAIKRHLAGRALRIAVVAPDAEALRAKLIAGAPSPKSYAAKVADEVLKLDEQVVGYDLKIAPQNVRVVAVDELFVR